MRRLKLDVLEVGEARWTGVGSVEKPDRGCFIYSGGQEHKHGVGVFLNKHAVDCLAEFCAVSERVILARLKGKSYMCASSKRIPLHATTVMKKLIFLLRCCIS